jgi:hypothetical protein
MTPRSIPLDGGLPREASVRPLGIVGSVFLLARCLSGLPKQL